MAVGGQGRGGRGLTVPVVANTSCTLCWLASVATHTCIIPPLLPSPPPTPPSLSPCSTGMFTGIFQDKKSSNPLRDILFKPLSAEDVAEAIVEAVGSPVSVNRTMPVIIAWVHCFVRLLPLGLQDAIIGFFGGWHGMTSFQGRGKEREQAGGQSSPSAAEGAATTAHATAAASADQRKDSSSPLPSDARKRSNSVSASSRSVQKPSSSSSLSSGSVAAAAVSPRHRGTGRTVGSGAAAMPQR